MASASMVLLVVVVLVIWRMSLARANNRTIEAIRRAGNPTSQAQLNEWYVRIPAEENAALLLTEAMEALRTRSAELAKLKMPDRGGRLANAALVKGYVETNQAALELVKAALERTQCRYNVNFYGGPNTDYQHLGHLRNLAQLGDYAALLAAERGDSAAAAEQIANMAGLAGTLQDEPVLISQRVRISILRMAVRRFERALSVTKFSETDLSRLARVFGGAAKTNCIARAMIGERAMMISIFRASGAEFSRLMSSGGTPPKGPNAEELVVFPVLKMTGFLERDLRYYLEAMAAIIERSRLGPPQSLRAKEVDDSYGLEARRKYCLLSAVFLPGLSHMFAREADALAFLRLAEMACAIEQFAKARGGFPRELSDLAPVFIAQVASDPYDGKTVRYQQLEDGYVLYSIGADRRDDGGTELKPQASSSEGAPEDLVFKVQVPK